MKRLLLGLLIAALAVTAWLTGPDVVRRLAVWRIEALTGRPASIDTVALDLRQSHVTIRGVRILDRDGTTPFAHFEQVDLRLYPRALLRGHLWLHEVVIRESNVHVVRLSKSEFNISDLVRSSESAGPSLDVTVDRFTLVGGRVTLEDRALPQWRTWTSDQIFVEASNLSTLRSDGSAVARTVLEGAPVSVDVDRVRLHPIHLEGLVTVTGADLAMARVYLPPEGPVTIERGNVSASVGVTLDARAGLRVDVTTRLADLALARPGDSTPIVMAPDLTIRLTGFAVDREQVRVARLDVSGALAAPDPRRPGGRIALPGVNAKVANLTWPLSEPAQVVLETGLPGGGKLAANGALRAAPEASQLRLRLSKLDLTPWAQYLPTSARVGGIARADLEMNEPIGAGVPARIRGSIAVDALAVGDGRRNLVGARSVEASGLEVRWPASLSIKRVAVNRPWAIVERDQAGRLPLTSLLSGQSPGAASPPIDQASAERDVGTARPTPPLAVEVGEIAVREGSLSWRDNAVAQPVRADVAKIAATVTGAAWPSQGALGVRLSVEPPRGGMLHITGKVDVATPAADLRVSLKGLDLAPYQSYLPTTARVSGFADLDATMALATAPEMSARVRGQAALARLDVRDGQRTVMRVERAVASRVDAQWPQRIAVGELALERPWILLERDETGGFPVRALLPLRGAPPEQASTRPASAAVVVQRITVEDGGLRVVDRSIAPAFATDVQRLAVQLDGLATSAVQPARVELKGRVGHDAELALRGTIGALDGPPRVDVSAELREFAIPRANPYLLRQVAWKAREGRVVAAVRARVRGDSLDARTDIGLKHLAIERAGPDDQAQAHIGLPLGFLVSLMQDTRGEIRLSVPIGGRLNDPRFDFREAVWSSLRAVAIHAIALPVSWIGRLRYTPDARIEKVQIDPVAFRPGTASLTPEGDAHTARLAAFLEQTPAVRLSFTPIVTSRDLDGLRRQTLEKAIERAARDGRVSPDEAAARLFAQRFPGRPLPDSSEDILSALLEVEAPPAKEFAALAEQRLEAVRKKLEQAGIDRGRLVDKEPVERRAGNGGVDVDLLEAGPERKPGLRDFLRRLGAESAAPLGPAT